MRIIVVTALAAALVGGCGGGGQTEPTEAEQALGNGYAPTAPSPGSTGNEVDAAVPDIGAGEIDAGAINGADSAPVPEPGGGAGTGQ